MAQHHEIVNEVIRDERFFRVSTDILSKIFLSNFIDSVFQKSFEAIKKEYEELTYSEAVEDLFGKIQLPENEKSFYDYILKRELSLSFNPRDRKLELYNNAINHLNEIDKNLEDLNKALEEINKRRETKNTDGNERMHSYLINHYVALNNKAKDEILIFLKGGLNEYILKERNLKSISSSFLPVSIPYAYEWNPRRYKLRYPTELDNKFGDLFIQEYRDIAEQFKTDKSKIDPFILEYINKKECLKEIKSLISHNHILIKRKTLNEAIELFELSKLRSFIAVASLQIEGLFFDYCIELGLNPKDGEDFTFGDSLDFIVREQKDFYNFEYYAFQLRMSRNFSAHPKSELEDSKLVFKANVLLLDILAVLRFFNNPKLRSNRGIQFIKDYEKNSIDIYKIISNHDLFADTGSLIKIDEFYKDELNKVLDLRDDLMKDSFWLNLNTYVDNQERIEDLEKTLSVLGKFKKREFEKDRTKNMISKIEIKISKLSEKII